MDTRGFNLTSHRIWLVLAAVFIASTLLAGCAPSLPTLGQATNQTAGSPSVHLVIDRNMSTTVNSKPDLRAFVVALDPHTGHTIWRHQLETSRDVSGPVVNWQSMVAGDSALVEYGYPSGQAGVEHTVLGTLDFSLGQFLWRHEVGNFLEGEPVIAGSTVYLSALNIGVTQPSGGVVEALDLQSGRLLWSHPVHEALSPPSVAGDKVFVFGSPASKSGNEELFAFNASDGSMRWDYKYSRTLYLGGDGTDSGYIYSGYTAPVTGNQLVYVAAVDSAAGGTTTEKLVALEAGDGKLAWQHSTDIEHSYPALSQRGDILCFSETGHTAQGGNTVVGLDAKTGQTRWTTNTDEVESRCLPGGDAFYISEKGPAVRTSTGGYYPGIMLALASEDGHQLWRSQATAALSPTEFPWVTHGLVGQIVTLPHTDPISETAMVVYRADSGALVWQHELQGSLPGAPQIEGDRIYITTLDSSAYSSAGLFASWTVYAFSLSTGAQLWTHESGHV